jgi:hypothetical protein
MEPVTSGASQIAKALAAIKDLPLWLLTAIALFLFIFLSVPVFGGAVSENTRTWITAAAIASAIFAACHPEPNGPGRSFF